VQAQALIDYCKQFDIEVADFLQPSEKLCTATHVSITLTSIAASAHRLPPTNIARLIFKEEAE
jgi:hypothetical protein